MRNLFLFIAISYAMLSFAYQDSINVHFSSSQPQLEMDIYIPKNKLEKAPCVIYAFGGGFYKGDRNWYVYKNFYNNLLDSGYCVVAIDYRLGLKGLKRVGIKDYKHASEIAAEDMIEALSYIIKNADKYGVDTEKIILAGNSAGAITSLNVNWILCNGWEKVSIPEDFRLAGVLAFAGGVMSTKGVPKYKKYAPAPTMFAHGEKDNIVPYNSIQIFNAGMFGSNKMRKIYKKLDVPYYFISYPKNNHEIHAVPMIYNMDYIHWFLGEMVFKKRHVFINQTYEADGLTVPHTP